MATTTSLTLPTPTEAQATIAAYAATYGGEVCEAADAWRRAASDAPTPEALEAALEDCYASADGGSLASFAAELAALATVARSLRQTSPEPQFATDLEIATALAEATEAQDLRLIAAH